MKITLSAVFVNTTQQWPISVDVLINNESVWKKTVSTEEYMQIEIDDVVASRKISIRFSGKTNVADGIAASTAIIIKDIQIQGIDVEPVLQKIATYQHCTNGSSGLITAEYTNFVGFDGTIEFNLDTPISNWFYKNYTW